MYLYLFFSKAAYSALGEKDPCSMELQGIVKAFPKRKKVKDDSQNVGPAKVLKGEETRNVHCESLFLSPVFFLGLRSCDGLLLLSDRLQVAT